MSNIPNEETTFKPERRRFGCLKSLLIGVVAVLVVGLVAVAVLLSGIVTKVANDQLPKQLGTEATLGGAQVNLLAGRFHVHDLDIQQPEEFATFEEPLLTLGNFTVNLPVRKALSQDPIVIRRVHLDGLSLNLISDTNAVLNVLKLGPPPPEEPEPEPEEASEPGPIPPVWVKRVLLENIELAYQDLAKEWSIELSDIRFELDDLQIMESQTDGPARLRGEVSFKGGRATGKLLLHARLGVITPDKPEQVPPVQVAMGLIGFDLDLVKPFLKPSPAVAKTAIGGNGFDFTLFMQIGPGTGPETQEISGSFELATDGGQKTDDDLGGTLAEPVLPFTSLFADILGNQFGRVTKLGTNVAQGGLEAGKAVGKTGVAAVKGVGKTVGGLAGGVLRTAKGVATLDKDEALGGMSDATVGTVKNAAGTVSDTAGTAGQGLKDTAGKVTGGDDVKRWWEEVKTRQQEFDRTADTWFQENPFPTKSSADAPAASPPEPETAPETEAEAGDAVGE